LRLSQPGVQHDLTAGACGASCGIVEADDLSFKETAPEPSRFVRLSDVTAPLVSVLKGGPAPNGALELAVVEVLARFDRFDRPKRLSPLPPAWLLRAREELAEAVDPPRFADLARAHGVHPAHFARAFREFFGLSAGEWFRLRRLHRAADRLLRTDEPISQVAAAEGFADQAHLTRQFRSRFGQPPNAWRRARKSRSRPDASGDASFGIIRR
jgi:AraC-like DNA-binding protein